MTSQHLSGSTAKSWKTLVRLVSFPGEMRASKLRVKRVTATVTRSVEKITQCFVSLWKFFYFFMLSKPKSIDRCRLNLLSALVKSYACNRPWRPIGLWDVEAPKFYLDNRLTNGGEDVSPTRRLPFIPMKIPGTHFCYRMSRPQGHNAAGRTR
jgi:hypothetical protein